MLQGWNTIFIKCADINGKTSYRLHKYILYGFIPIVGVIVAEDNGKWYFTRECDNFPMYVNNNLLGVWVNEKYMS